MNVHVIADSDTRWKWGAAAAARLTPDGAAIHGHLLEGRATPSEQQLADIGAEVTSVRRVAMATLLTDLAEGPADVVVLACVGGTIQALLHGLARAWTHRTPRPVVVTGYVGLVYERLVDGLMLRAGADILLANSAADTRRFRAVFDAVGVDADSIVTTALPFLDGEPWDARAAGSSRRFTVCFVAQPSVPETRAERHYALSRAVQHARRHPDRNVVVKLRGRVGEQTTHLERHHYSSLLPDVEIPANVEFVYGRMSDVLDRTDLCVTVSSTAALEAMHRGIPTAVLTDFGVREELGNHAFLGSGALTSWRALDEGEVPKVDPAWTADHGVGDPAPYDAARRRLAELLATPGDRGPLRPWFTVADSPAYLPALLARYGVDVDGRPLAGGPTRLAGSGYGRRALRAFARQAYQVGVGRLEPRIRRWAQL
jgi:putative glycosyltransferase DUF6716